MFIATSFISTKIGKNRQPVKRNFPTAGDTGGRGELPGCRARRPGSDPGAENHMAPEVGYASGARKDQMMVSRLPEQDGECRPRPELDVAAFPQGAQVIIHFVGQGDGEVLQVAVVGRGDDELASLPLASRMRG